VAAGEGAIQRTLDETTQHLRTPFFVFFSRIRSFWQAPVTNRAAHPFLISPSTAKMLQWNKEACGNRISGLVGHR